MDRNGAIRNVSLVKINVLFGTVYIFSEHHNAFYI